MAYTTVFENSAFWNSKPKFFFLTFSVWASAISHNWERNYYFDIFINFMWGWVQNNNSINWKKLNKENERGITFMACFWGIQLVAFVSLHRHIQVRNFIMNQVSAFEALQIPHNIKEFRDSHCKRWTYTMEVPLSSIIESCGIDRRWVEYWWRFGCRWNA